MLETINEPVPSSNDGSKSAFNRNDNSRSVSKKNNGDSEVDEFGSDGVEYALKLGKSKG